MVDLDVKELDKKVHGYLSTMTASMAAVYRIFWGELAAIQLRIDTEDLIDSVQQALHRLCSRWWWSLSDAETNRMLDEEISRLSGQGFGALRLLCELDDDVYDWYRKWVKSINTGERCVLVKYPKEYANTMIQFIEKE